MFIEGKDETLMGSGNIEIMEKKTYFCIQYLYGFDRFS